MDRLIVCQGTAQLVTAVAALRQHVARSMQYREKTGQSRDHLLICGLAVAEPQVAEFVRIVQKMAALLHPFATISNLSDAQLRRLFDDAQRASSTSEIATLFRQTTGIGTIDEVFTVRDWQPCNILALSAFPDATHVCYGDSVGVYLPRGFMAAAPTAWSRITGLLKRRVTPRSGFFATARLDVSYLLLPGAFGMPPSGEIVRTDVVALRDLFIRLSPLLDPPLLDMLRKQITARHVWVLIGSNFAEQGMMTPQAEIAAYRDWIVGLRPEPGTVLLIKSHPRDRVGKRELLQQQLRDLFSEVWSADSIGGAYLPIETLLFKLIPIAASVQNLTVSTACLGTHFVVGGKTHIGFGDDLVNKYVVADRRKARCQHELELRRLLHE